MTLHTSLATYCQKNASCVQIVSQSLLSLHETRKIPALPASVNENAEHATKRHILPQILRQSPKKHAQFLIKKMKRVACRLQNEFRGKDLKYETRKIPALPASVNENAEHATKRHIPPQILRQSPKKHAQFLIKRMKRVACRLPNHNPEAKKLSQNMKHDTHCCCCCRGDL